MSLFDLAKSPEARVPKPSGGQGEIRDLADPQTVVIPLEYPGQVLFSPEVSVGETVVRNQVVGRSERGYCVHASISGTVREMRTLWTPSSHHVPAVVIDRAEGKAPGDNDDAERHVPEISRSSSGELLRTGGVLSPWTAPGWRQHEADVVDYPEAKHVVIVGYDEEPTITASETLLMLHAERLRTGVERVRDLAPRADYRILVRKAVAAKVRDLMGDAFEVIGVDDQYQRRLMRLLVPEVTGEDLSHTVAYRQHGIAVMSVEETLSVLNAVDGQPVTHKVLTVAGAGVDVPVTVRTPMGTTVKDLLVSLDLGDTDPARVVIGGPMQGKAVASLDTPIDKFCNGLFLLADEDLPSERNLICIHCGRCTRACPVNLQVHLLGRAVEFDELDQAREFHPEVCLECGLCAFVCPSHRPLVQLVRIAKQYGGEAS